MAVPCRRAADAEEVDRHATAVAAAALLATTATGEEEEIVASVTTLLTIEAIVAVAEETASIEGEIATTIGTVGMARVEEMTVATTETAMTADVAEERTTVDTKIAAALMRVDAEAAIETAREIEEMTARTPEEDATTARRSLTILPSTRKRRSISTKTWLRERSKSSTTMTTKRTRARRLPRKIKKLARMTRPRTHLTNNRMVSRRRRRKIPSSPRKLLSRQEKRSLPMPRPSPAKLPPTEA